VGSLTWRLRFTPESPFMPWVTQNPIRTAEDVQTFQYLVEHTDFRLSLRGFQEEKAYVGDRGIVAVLGPVSPLQQMVNFDAGLEQVAYLLADSPAEMNEMLDTYNAKQIDMCEDARAGPGRHLLHP